MSKDEAAAREALRAHLQAFLLDYALTHTCDTEHDERFPLVDKLTS